MNIELSDKEKTSLVSVIERNLTDLRGEIASGGKHDWKVQMKQENRMIILVTHNISQAKRLADTITFMSSDNEVSQSPAYL